jgi:hypothetical protein
MSYKDGGYVVNSGGYNGGMDLPEPLCEAGKLFIPGVAYAMEHRDVMWKRVVGIIVALLFLFVFISAIYGWVKMGGFQGYVGQSPGIQTMGYAYAWGGAPGAAKNIKLSDPYHDAGAGKARDTFLGGNVGPEFVEQPNYILGQENMMRTALNNFQRLKAKGLAGDWASYWKNYQAENADDLSASLYDFGDDGFEGLTNAAKMRKAALGAR